MDLTRRSNLPELMDDPALPQADYERCLHDLAAVNRVTFTHRPTLRWLDRATHDLPARSGRLDPRRRLRRGRSPARDPSLGRCGAAGRSGWRAST